MLLLEYCINFTSVTLSIAKGFPSTCDDAGAERLRQAFVGHDNLPPDTERQPLRLYIHDIDDKLYLGINEFQILLNRLPVANVCYEARTHAAALCRDRTEVVDLIYTKQKPGAGDEILQPIFLRPKTVVVTIPYRYEKRAVRFRSAGHLVEVVDRVFGDCVERLVLNFWVDAHNDYEMLYWPHVGNTSALYHAYVLSPITSPRILTQYAYKGITYSLMPQIMENLWFPWRRREPCT